MQVKLSFNTLSGKTSTILDASEGVLRKVHTFLSSDSAIRSVEFPFEGVLVTAELVD